MKKIIYLLLTISIIAYSDIAAQTEAESAINIEQQHRTLLENYIADLNKDDWASTTVTYLTEDPQVFVENHKKFRNALANYKATIKHLVVEDNHAMAWLTVNGKHVGKYDGFYGIEPINKDLEWEEVWYFDIVDGKFGLTWDFMGQDLSIMKQMGIQEIPRIPK